MSIVRVQSNSGFVSGGTTLNVAFASNNVAGNTLIALVLGSLLNSNTISDPSNQWVPLGDDVVYPDGSGHGRLSGWCVPSCVNGPNTVTAANAFTGGDIHLHIYEISGLATPTNTDVFSINSGTGITPSITTDNPVTQSEEYVIGCFADWDTNSAWTSGSGYTIRQQTNNSTTGDSLASEDNNVTTGLSGVQTVPITKTNTNDIWLGMVVTFKTTYSGSVGSFSFGDRRIKTTGYFGQSDRAS